MCFGPDEDQHQIEQNFRNLLIIYMAVTSTHKINNIYIFDLFVESFFIIILHKPMIGPGMR